MVVVSHQFKANAIEADLRAKAINSKGVRTSSRGINRDKCTLLQDQTSNQQQAYKHHVSIYNSVSIEGVCRGDKLSAVDRE